MGSLGSELLVFLAIFLIIGVVVIIAHVKKKPDDGKSDFKTGQDKPEGNSNNEKTIKK